MPPLFLIEVRRGIKIMKGWYRFSLHCVLSLAFLALSAEEETISWGMTVEDGEIAEYEGHLALSPEEQLKKEGSYEITPHQIPKLPSKKASASFQALVLPLITISLVIAGIVVTKINQGQEVT
jgi:hypothetical protein